MRADIVVTIFFVVVLEICSCQILYLSHRVVSIAQTVSGARYVLVMEKEVFVNGRLKW